MKQLNCLLLDDDPIHRSRYERWVKQAWEALGRDVPIHIRLAPRFEDATEALVQDSGTINLFLVDLTLGNAPEDEKLGVRAIKDCQDAYPWIGIVTITAGSGHLIEEAFSAGAHAFISKQHVVEKPAEANRYIAEKLLLALDAVGQVPYRLDKIQFDYDQRDLRLRVVVEEVSEETIKCLCVQLFSQSPKCIVPYFVAAGLSGAQVLRLDCEILSDSGTGSSVHNILLKMDREASRLLKEYERRALLWKLAASLRVEYYEVAPSKLAYRGWNGLAARFRTKARPLVEWLVDLGSEKAEQIDHLVSNCFDRLFLSGGLSEVYKHSAMFLERDKNTNDELRFPNAALALISGWAKAKLVSRLGMYREIIERKLLKQLDTAAIEDFLQQARVCTKDVTRFTRGVWQCWNHGDLHGENILVQPERGDPVIIDPANVGETFPLGTDVARLMVSLIMGGWDASVEHWFWERIDVWLSKIEAVFDSIETEETLRMVPVNGIDTTNLGVECALKWMIERLGQILGMQTGTLFPPWKFEILLAVEFLRSSVGKGDVPMPKRLFAILAAQSALRRADQCTPADAMRQS